MGKDNRQISDEDPLADYHPFIDEIKHIRDIVGEAATLHMFARNPEFAKTLQDLYRLAFHHATDISKLSPKLLADMAKLGLKLPVIIQLSLPPKKRQPGYFDLGQNIPQAYLEYLLKQTHPFDDFLSDVLNIEVGRVCSAEIERRKSEHPELTEMISYKWATPEREARKYLRERTLSERADLAKKYGLEILCQMQMGMARVLDGLSEHFVAKFGFEKGYSEFLKFRAKVSNDFPKFEKKIWAKLVENSLVPQELGKHIETQCKCLERCVAIDYFGLEVKRGYCPQQSEVTRALTKMAEILRIKPTADQYQYALDRGVSIDDDLLEHEAEDGEVQTWLVESNAGMEAMEGLAEGMNKWAAEQVDAIIIAALQGRLRSSLKLTVKHDLIDATRKQKRHMEHQVTESEIDTGCETELNTPLDSVAFGKELEPQALEELHEIEQQRLEQPPARQDRSVDLESLGFNIDELTSTELQAIERVYRGLSEGYSLDSKTGNSLRQYLGDDYPKTMKAFDRARAKLKKP